MRLGIVVRLFYFLLVKIVIKNRPKTGFTFLAEDVNGAENEVYFSSQNQNENCCHFWLQMKMKVIATSNI